MPDNDIKITVKAIHLWLAVITIVLSLSVTGFTTVFTLKDAYDQIDMNKQSGVENIKSHFILSEKLNEQDDSIDEIKFNLKSFILANGYEYTELE